MTKHPLQLHRAQEEGETTEGVSPELSLEEQIQDLRERVASLERMAHNEHSLPPETIASIVRAAVREAVAHLAKSLALGKVLLDEQ